MRKNEASNSLVVALIGYRPDGAITNGNNHFENRVRSGTQVIRNIRGQESPEDMNNAGGQYTRPISTYLI